MKHIKKDYLAIITILLMCITSLAGIFSMDFNHKMYRELGCSP